MTRFFISNLAATTACALILAFPGGTQAAGVDLPTTCSTQADAAVDDGLGLLHNMMYIQAEETFNRAAATDPDCAMAHWGVAMANFHPLWPGAPTQEEMARGSMAAEKLATLAPGNDLEVALTSAVAAFYRPEHKDYRSRIIAWAEAQKAAHEKTPDSIDTAAFSALAQIATAPRGSEQVATLAEIGTFLDGWHAKVPDHIGVIHYAIHTYDNPVLKQRGLPYAQIYDKIAPTAPHALHMPAHIFTRLGSWRQSIDLNRRSAEAALEQSGDVLQSHYVHAVDYMVYGYLQIGETAKAEAIVAEMLSKTNHQVTFGGAYALAASPVRVVLEQDQWAKAAALSPTLHASIPWEKFPQAESMLWFAKGLGAARSGDVEASEDALAKLKALQTVIQASGPNYWSELTDGQILTVQAWIALANGEHGNALALQTKAADLEDRIGKHPVTPGHVLPARELLGDMHAAVGNDENAAAAYQAVLELYPNRARSLDK